jgi:hypothetical protein
MGCLVFIALAALTLVAALVLGPVFAISDSIKWVLAWVAKVAPPLLAVAAVFFAWVAVAYYLDCRKWAELHKPGNTEKLKAYLAQLGRHEKAQEKKGYLQWLNMKHNADKKSEAENLGLEAVVEAIAKEAEWEDSKYWEAANKPGKEPEKQELQAWLNKPENREIRRKYDEWDKNRIAREKAWAEMDRKRDARRENKE